MPRSTAGSGAASAGINFAPRAFVFTPVQNSFTDGFFELAFARFRPMTTASNSNHFARAEWLAAGLVTAVIFGLQLFLLFHAGCFCGDEVQILNLSATQSLSEMTHDSFPVLLPLLVRGWTALGLGDSDFHLRWLGLLMAAGIIAALWLASLTARRPPLLGLIFFGLNANAIYWSEYLRGYGAGSLLNLVTLAAMVFFLARPTWLRAAWLALAAALSVQA